jgi:hypothetical protein
MVKLNLTGQNLGRVFSSRLRRACACRANACIAKRPNLKLKTQPQETLGSLLLGFAPPALALLANIRQG